MSETIKTPETPTPNNKNAIYISIISAVIVIIALVFVLKGCGNGGNGTNPNHVKHEGTSPAPISVVNEEGNQNDTIKAKTAVRNIKFGQSINKVKKAEAKLKDTLDNPSQTASTEDGYIYLSYRFNPEDIPTFYGAEVSPTSSTAMLMYVFHNEKLIEVRIQYGAIGVNGYDQILAHNNNKFGKATYSRTYSNGSQQSWWKTKNATLDVINQNNEVIAYYRQNN